MLSSDTHVLTPLSPLLSPDREIQDALDRERVRADIAEASVAELKGKLCDAQNSAREWKVESITARCGLNKLQAIFKWVNAKFLGYAAAIRWAFRMTTL